MVNKTYKDNLTGEIIKVIDIYENIAITDSKSKIDARRLLDERFYTEWIDPKNFFSSESTYSAFAEKIQNIDLSNIPDDVDDINESVKITSSDPNFLPIMSESAVLPYDPEEEKMELMRKYGVQEQNIQSVQKQNEAFSKILEDSEETSQPMKIDKPRIIQESFTHVNVEDPIISMFKNVKRKEDFSLDIKIESKIPRVDFIEMMEDSYEVSIIEFLAEEMTQNLLNNPEFIKNKIIDQIKSLLSCKTTVEQPKPKTRRTKKELENNDQ